MKRINLKDEVITKPKSLQTPYDEMQILARLYDGEDFEMLKRLARRMTDELRKQSFLLSADEQQFEIKHTRYKEQAVGVSKFLDLIKQAKLEFDKMQ